MNIQISVIIPCYNAEKYLDACLESVLSQSGCEMEVLLVNDGSKDGTAALCDAWAQRDSRVRVWHSENRGVSAARNLALAHARGEWVTFVDADDLLPEGALLRLLHSAKGDTDVVIAAHEEFYDDGTRQAFAPERFFDSNQMEKARDILTRRLIEGDCVYNIMCSKLHRRAHLEAHRVRLDESVRIGEDAVFNLRSLYQARKVVYIPEIGYSYRIHKSSAMGSSEGRDFERMRPFFSAMRAALEELSIVEKYFPALCASAALRLYKESALAGVIRRFDADARPLLKCEGVHGFAAWLVRRGLYGAAWVMAYPFMAVRWKALEAARRLRHE